MGFGNIEYLLKTDLKLKSHEIFYAYNLFLNGPIIFKFCTEHGSYTVMPFAKLKNDWSAEIDIMDKQVSWDLSFRWVLEIFILGHWASANWWNLVEAFFTSAFPLILNSWKYIIIFSAQSLYYSDEINFPYRMVNYNMIVHKDQHCRVKCHMSLSLEEKLCQSF